MKQAGNGQSRRPVQISKKQIVKFLNEFTATKHIRNGAHKTQKQLFPNWKHQNDFFSENFSLRKKSHSAGKGVYLLIK